MPCQLPADCLNEMLEHLKKDLITLHSCLLVNRFWCKIAVRILWRNQNFRFNMEYQKHVPLATISTLIACLPNESKDLLYNNGIQIPTWKPSLFNYASFCRVLSVHRIDRMIQYVLEKEHFITTQGFNYNKYLLSQEILKMFMNQISSLKYLNYHAPPVQYIMFTYFPGANNCLMNLKKLNCSSNVSSDFFYQISQVCRNIQSINISFRNTISDGLTDLISLQNNLKSITLHSNVKGIEVIIPSLSKISSTLTKLELNECHIPLSFISMFTNLQDLTLSFDHNRKEFDGFNQLQHVRFSQLKALSFLYEFPKFESLIKFLEINGKNLKELHIGDTGENDNSFNLAIAEFCPNLKALFTLFLNDELETLKVILNSCQYLESIKVWCGVGYLKEKEILDIIVKYSSKNFHKLRLYYDTDDTDTQSEILPDDLESFFIRWKNRIPQKPLTLVIIKQHECIGLEVNGENMKVIEKYKKLGIIRKLVIIVVG